MTAPFGPYRDAYQAPVVLPELTATARPMNDIERVLVAMRLTQAERDMMARSSRIEGNQAGANILPGLAAGAVQAAGTLPNWTRDVAGSWQGDVLARLLGSGPAMERLRQDSRQLTGANPDAKGNDLLEFLGNMAPVAAPDLARLLGAVTEAQRAAVLQDFQRVMADRGGYIGPLHHGSPHRFDRFDAGKVLTGEGANAYGRGLYFTDVKDIAKHYAAKLTKDGAGNVYTVDLPNVSDADFVNYDLPIEKQSKKVQRALSEIFGFDVTDTGGDTVTFEDIFRGGDFSVEELSRELARRGIAGVKYAAGKFDNFSGETGNNYVVFNDADIRMLGRE